MSKKSGSKRSALQRLSESMNSLIASTDAKRRKLNQTKCDKLKLKPDPASLFKRFEMKSNCGGEDSDHDDNDINIRSGLTSGASKRPLNQKPRMVLKTWTPPLKTNRNTEQLFDKLQNSERNIGINDKSKMEMKKRKRKSETVTSTSKEEEINKSEIILATDSESSQEITEIKASGNEVLVDVTSTNNDAVSNNFNADDQNDLTVNVKNNFANKHSPKLNISPEIDQNSPENILNKTKESLHEVSEQPNLLNNVDVNVKNGNCNRKLFSNSYDSDVELDLIFNENIKTETDLDEIFVQTQGSLKENDNLSVFNETNNNLNENISEYTVEEKLTITTNEKKFDCDKSINDEDGNLELKYLKSDDDLKEIGQEGKCNDLTDENISIHNVQSSQNCEEYREIVIDEENYIIIDHTAEDEEKNICETDNDKTNSPKVKDDNFQKIEDNHEDIFLTCKTEADYDLDQYINSSIDKSLTQQNDDITADVHEITPNDSFNKSDHTTENNVREEPREDVEINNLIDEKCERNKPEDEHISSSVCLDEKNDFADGMEEEISTSICEKPGKNLTHHNEIVDGNETQKPDSICEKSATIDSDENYLSLSEKIREKNVDETFDKNTDKLSEIPHIVPGLHNTCDEIVIEDTKSETNEPIQIKHLENDEVNMKENYNSQKNDEWCGSDSQPPEDSQIISLDSSNKSQENNLVSSINLNENEFVQTDCKNIKKNKKYDDLIECSDDFYNIPMSEVIRIENEYTETKMKSISKQTADNNNQIINKDGTPQNNVCANKIWQQNLVPTMNADQSHQFSVQPQLKLGWVQKMNEEKQKLRSIIQEINKLNNMVLQARKELWPHRFDNN